MLRSFSPLFTFFLLSPFTLNLANETGGTLMTAIIQTNNLTKRFAQDNVIQNVTMTIQKGEIYGFLGPNGAGKTTVMKMLLNLLKPTSGDMFIQGKQVQLTSYDYLKNIGNLIEYPIFYENQSAQKNLELHCLYMGGQHLDNIPHVLTLVGLNEVGNKQVKSFSLGMRQRLAIAKAIVTKPDILILDEPTNGLDPIGIKEIRELLLQLKQQGMTILISSHIVAEIESIADTIGILKDGQLIEEVSMKVLREKTSTTLEIVVGDVKRAKRLLENAFALSIHTHDETLKIEHFSGKPSSIVKFLVEQNIDVEKVETHHQSLEQYFVQRIEGGL